MKQYIQNNAIARHGRNQETKEYLQLVIKGNERSKTQVFFDKGKVKELLISKEHNLSFADTYIHNLKVARLNFEQDKNEDQKGCILQTATLSQND